ncbi:MAG: tetratricopeptide repeat protein [Prevotellaceae bacterium]|jgi:tetratricopeptide (TPR) repeat protein|nr:tetratricopeptide repeat protein [Prevotellaceae bacterium]
MKLFRKISKWTGAALLCLLLYPAQAQYDKVNFFYRGRQFLVDNKYTQAINVFNLLIKTDTSLYEAYLFRGIAKYNLNDFIGAQADFGRAIQVNPVYTPAYHYRAITSSRMGKYDDALRDLKEAMSLRPGYAGLYYSRGITYFLSQQFERAIEDFNRFLRFEPKVGEAYLNRGTAHLLLKDTTAALNDYNTAILLNKFEPEGYVRRARIYALQEKNDKAIENLNEAIRLDSANTFAYFNRALVRSSMKDINGALADLQKVLRLDPDNALTLYNRALIRSQIGDYDNALQDYEKVIDINPNNVLVYYNRAAVYIELNRYRQALNDYDKAIELYPDFANAYMNRAYVKSRLGLVASANDDRKTAQRKIEAYKQKIGSDSTFSMYADTSKQFNRLLAFDAEFARNDFSQDLLQYRKIDIRLKPLFKLMAAAPARQPAFDRQYFNPTLELLRQLPELPLYMVNETQHIDEKELLRSDSIAGAALRLNPSDAGACFRKGITQFQLRRFNDALLYFNRAIETDPDNALYYINRSALQSEMIDFIASIENNMQVLSLDNSGVTKTVIQDQVTREYSYDDAINDLNTAARIMPDMTYIYYNLGNLRCLSNAYPEAISNYTYAIQLYPYFGEAFYNRGLVHIYLRETEKGCLDISKAGELGIDDAYSVIRKYCIKKDNL